MADKKEDLRVKKTRRNIKEEFMKLLKKKSIDKITVKELCENALINKGTFYLHYNDIYCLYKETILNYIETSLGVVTYYEEFFKNPRSFISKFLRDFQSSDFLDHFPNMDIYKERVPLPHIINEAILSHILDTELIAPTIENKIKIYSCIATMNAPLMHFGIEYQEIIARISGDLIANSFKKNEDGKTFE